MSKYAILKSLGAALSPQPEGRYTVIDRATGSRNEGLSKEEAALEIVARNWSMHYFLDIAQCEDGQWGLGGERHFVNADGDWDGEDFWIFAAATKDEVLDHVLAPHLGNSVILE